MADALEDDFVLSDGESDAGSAAAGSLYDGDGGAQGDIQVESLAKRTSKDTEATSAKRRATDGDSDESGEEAARERKKQKRKAKKAKKAALNLATEPGAVARMPPDMQADHMLSLMRSCRAFSKMTELELDEVVVREPMLVDTTSLRATDRTLDALSAFIKKAAPTAVQSASRALTDNHACGEPCILMVTGNAQRAADISRALRSLGTESGRAAAAKGGKKVAVAKLFARHFKVVEQVQFLRSHVCPLAVGTPQRLVDLLQHQPLDGGGGGGGERGAAAALRLSRLQCIVLDASWCDQKQRTLLDGIETRQALFGFLATDDVRERMRATEVGVGKSAEIRPAKVVLF